LLDNAMDALINDSNNFIKVNVSNSINSDYKQYSPQQLDNINNSKDCKSYS